MKGNLVIAICCLSFLSWKAFADVVILNEYEQISDVKVQLPIIGDTISYTEEGVLKHIAKNNVSAVLFDNGRYQEIIHSTPAWDIPDSVLKAEEKAALDVLKQTQDETTENVSQQKHTDVSSETTNQDSKVVNILDANNTSATPTIIPQQCMNLGNEEYKRVFAEQRASALQKGYSKRQAYMLASDAAFKAKQQVIEECTKSVEAKP